MNKQMLLKVSLVCALVAAGSTAYASTAITGAITMGGGTFAPSKNVTINVVSCTGGYAAISYHSQGDKLLGTNNVDTKIYYSLKSSSASTSTPGSSSEPFSGWSSL